VPVALHEHKRIERFVPKPCIALHNRSYKILTRGFLAVSMGAFEIVAVFQGAFEVFWLYFYLAFTNNVELI